VTIPKSAQWATLTRHGDAKYKPARGIIGQDDRKIDKGSRRATIRLVNTDTRDADLRAAMHHRVLKEHHQDADTLVVDELGLWYGTARIDIAVINGEIHGYEIKSDRDTFERLPGQVQAYCRVLDRVTLVVGEHHADAVAGAVPEWWGLKVARRTRRRTITFDAIRRSRRNPCVDSLAVAALLWRDELLAELDERSAARGMRGKARGIMAERLVAIAKLDELRAVVRRRLKLRGDWRSAGPRT